jgi:DNA/RNA-binding domain of Phe-tRNA-synthetase-like protein
VIAGQPLPAINALVDLNNMASLETGLCLGCSDLDKTLGGVVFRFSRPDDSFLDMGAEAGEDPNDPARSSTPTRVTCSAGGGTGARILAAPQVSKPAAPF